MNWEWARCGYEAVALVVLVSVPERVWLETMGSRGPVAGCAVAIICSLLTAATWPVWFAVAITKRMRT